MISLEWVSDYVDITNEDLKELAVKIKRELMLKKSLRIILTI